MTAELVGSCQAGADERANALAAPGPRVRRPSAIKRGRRGEAGEESVGVRRLRGRAGCAEPMSPERRLAGLAGNWLLTGRGPGVRVLGVWVWVWAGGPEFSTGTPHRWRCMIVFFFPKERWRVRA